jgi:hypothetical protein
MSALAASGVLNMMNTKYIVVNPEAEALENPFAFGPAWFAGEVKSVKSADEAIGAINTVDLRKVAIVREMDLANLTTQTSADSLSTVTCIKYNVNRLTYQVNASSEGLLVFSEIYYPEGWKCFVDGNETPYAEVNYVLRGIKCPAGQHTIEWRFEPASFASSSMISTAGSAMLLLLLLGTLFKELKGRTLK